MIIKKKQIKTGSAGIIAVIIIFIVLVIALGFIFIPNFFVTATYENDKVISDQSSVASEREEKKVEEEIITHVSLPEVVKSIYMTACVVGTPSFRNDLVEIVKTTEINSIIIDIKDFSGTISFPTNNPKLRPAWEAANCGTSDMKEFVKELHKEGIYVIGRITVFQDPLYTKAHPELSVQKASDRSTWKDYKGLSFIDVGAKDYWDYIVELSREAYGIGFDELNFDYIRFPSDGNMKDIYYPFSESKINSASEFGKAKALEEFFQYLDRELRSDFPALDTSKRPIISADLFGMTTTNSDDLNIGQVLERTLPYFDFVAPMVYPSHYPNGFNGYGNPNHYPHEIVEFSMTTAVNRIDEMLSSTTTPSLIKEKIHRQQLRPWLQDFDYGGDYGPQEVRTQIQATYDSGLTSWMLWAPSNRYTIDALLAE